MSENVSTIKKLLLLIYQSWETAYPKLTLNTQKTHFNIPGLKGSGRLLWTASMIAHSQIQHHFHLFITDTLQDAAYIENDLSNLLPNYQIFLFPPSHKENTTKINMSYKTLQTEALLDLKKTNGKKRIWVAPINAIMEKFSTLEEKNKVEIFLNQPLEITACMQLFYDYGFQAKDFVYEPGQIAQRGSIVDVFSFGHTLPYRIEFNDNEVISLRTFDTETQLSKQKLSRLIIVPKPMNNQSGATDYLSKKIPKNTCIWLDKWGISLRSFLANDKDVEDLTTKKNQVEQWKAFMYTTKVVDFSNAPLFSNVVLLEARQEPQPNFNRQFDLLIKNLKKFYQKNYTIFVSYTNPQQYERLYQICEDLNAEILLNPIPFSFKEGFIDHDNKIVIYTDHQIFSRYHQYRLRHIHQGKQTLNMKSLRMMQPGDYLTHIDHGVGIFSGLEKIIVRGKQQEAIRIIFRDNDILYVNIHSLHKVAKYSHKDGHVPRIHKLGSDTWAKLKEHTKRKAKAIAFDLIKLYAMRRTIKSFAHSPDNYLQNELESSFLYEETSDQKKAIESVKYDMQLNAPMDRLVCGDVGFGKTEVAIRAAFKAILDGKQVAVLVPTTVLAFQHYNSFNARMSFFSPRIEFLNRFKSAKEKRLIKENLKQGKIDLIIGTQALLAKDIEYKNLSLLIIDEEQKFGVSDKEKLKNIKQNVDCLTLTATPIPRTLQFSLMGAKDLSIIQTPPPNRQPPHTEVIDFDIDKIREVIEYEISRGGQVFFVHNKISDIDELTHMLRASCNGSISIDCAHGRLQGHKLEEKMIAFIKHQFDVLVCTNIVESGLDIPNVNTIIIHNAHKFGLSDLHQLRGRVGRSNKKAYCYLVTQPDSILSKEQKKRIEIIQEYSDLGSGFHISMKDLDIRGSGNILGGEQSGFINKIGFDTYQKILNEALQELQEEEFKDDLDNRKTDTFIANDCSIETDDSIYIPDNYIPSNAERIETYKKINDCKEENQIKELQLTFVDLFGKIPTIVLQLFQVVRCRLIGKTLGFNRIVHKNEQLLCFFNAKLNNPYFQSNTFGSILDFIQNKTTDITLKQKPQFAYLLITNIADIDNALEILMSMLKHKEELHT